MRQKQKTKDAKTQTTCKSSQTHEEKAILEHALWELMGGMKGAQEILNEMKGLAVCSRCGGPPTSGRDALETFDDWHGREKEIGSVDDPLATGATAGARDQPRGRLSSNAIPENEDQKNVVEEQENTQHFGALTLEHLAMPFAVNDTSSP